MELNRLVFPRPASSYSHANMKGKLIYIPKFEMPLLCKPPPETSFGNRRLSKQNVKSHLVPSENQSIDNDLDSLRPNYTTNQIVKPSKGAQQNFSLKKAGSKVATRQLGTEVANQRPQKFGPGASLNSNQLMTGQSKKSTQENHFTKSQPHTLGIRASQPYDFQMVRGAPSVKGKHLAEYSKRVKESCSMSRDSVYRINEFLSHYQSVDQSKTERRSPTLAFQEQQHAKATRTLSTKNPADFIPCMLFKYDGGSSKLFIYFHANAEDLGRAYKFLTFVHIYLRVHVLAVEYPGYGVYEGLAPTADRIIEDASTVYNFVTTNLNWKEEDIIVCGRSIGSGPAVYLAAHHSPSSLVLISPHTSIRGIVKDQWLGKYTQYAIAERFRNLETIAKVRAPTFILHGLRDNLVSSSHSQELCDACGGPSFLLLPEQMDHNNLDVINDFIAPLSEFLDNFNISTNNRDCFFSTLAHVRKQALEKENPCLEEVPNQPKSSREPIQPSSSKEETLESKDGPESAMPSEGKEDQLFKAKRFNTCKLSKKEGEEMDQKLLGTEFEDDNEEDLVLLEGIDDGNVEEVDDMDEFIPTDQYLKETTQSINRLHPALNQKGIRAKKVAPYKGPFLIVDSQYFCTPNELIFQAKSILKTAKTQPPFQNSITKSKMFEKKKQLRCAGNRQSVDLLDIEEHL